MRRRRTYAVEVAAPAMTIRRSHSHGDMPEGTDWVEGPWSPVPGVGAVVGSVVAVLIPAVRRGHAGGVAQRREVSVGTLPAGEVRPSDRGEQQDGGQPEDEG